MAKVQLLHDSDVEKTLADDDVEAFSYQLNKLGFSLVLFLGGAALSGAGYVFTIYGLQQALWISVFAGLAAVGVAMGIHAARWYFFQRTRFVAVSPNRLYVGKEGRMWSIDWEVLDARSLGFDELEATQLQGSMNVRAGGQTIEIHLYNALCYLQDIQGFMLEVLGRLKDQRDSKSDVESDPETGEAQVDEK